MLITEDLLNNIIFIGGATTFDSNEYFEYIGGNVINIYRMYNYN